MKKMEMENDYEGAGGGGGGACKIERENEEEKASKARKPIIPSRLFSLTFPRLFDLPPSPSFARMSATISITRASLLTRTTRPAAVASLPLRLRSRSTTSTSTSVVAVRASSSSDSEISAPVLAVAAAGIPSSLIVLWSAYTKATTGAGLQGDGEFVLGERNKQTNKSSSFFSLFDLFLLLNPDLRYHHHHHRHPHCHRHHLQKLHKTQCSEGWKGSAT